MTDSTLHSSGAPRLTLLTHSKQSQGQARSGQARSGLSAVITAVIKAASSQQTLLNQQSKLVLQFAVFCCVVHYIHWTLKQQEVVCLV